MGGADDASQPKCRLRVLVVDNDSQIRERYTELLLGWGFIPVVARGSGDALLEDAVKKARDHRCQIALVDMRLRDDYNKRDWSGLELVPKLQPTAAIIVSAFGDRLVGRVGAQGVRRIRFRRQSRMGPSSSR